MFRAIILISTLLLGSCSILTPEPEVIRDTEYVEKPLLHPDMPRPLRAYNPDWMVITKETIAEQPDNFVAQGLEWDQGQEYAIWLEDVKRYINQLLLVACSYRGELDEQVCDNVKKKQKEVENDSE